MTRRDVLISLAASVVALARVDGRQPKPDEDRWAREIAAFAADDEARPFEPGGIVFVGSSSIRLWDLASAFPGRRVLNRGSTVRIDSLTTRSHRTGRPEPSRS